MIYKNKYKILKNKTKNFKKKWIYFKNRKIALNFKNNKLLIFLKIIKNLKLNYYKQKICLNKMKNN
jgi:hypothetical protein